MIKKILLTGAVGGMLVGLAGCGGGAGASSTTKVDARTAGPTGNSAKLIDETKSSRNLLSGFEQEANDIQNNGDVKSVLEHALGDLDNSNPKMMKVAASESDALPSCVKNSIKTTDSETSASAKGSIVFDHCAFSGIEIDGKVTIDFTATRGENTERIKYSGSIEKLKVTLGEDELYIRIAKTKGSSTNKESEYTEESSSKNETGISGYIAQKGKKVLILDGVNTLVTLSEDESWGGAKGYSSTSQYALDVKSGYIGSDESGMFALETKATIQGDEKSDCPTEGYIVLKGKDTNIDIVAHGESIQMSDGEHSETISCD